MLLCREFLISSVRNVQPTYDSLSVLSEYLLLFWSDADRILDIILRESATGNAYNNLFLVYLINELLNKGCADKRVLKVGKAVLKAGKKKVLELSENSTERLKRSAKELNEKYLEMERLWQGAKKEPPIELDIEYLESLCQQKDQAKILEYLRQIDKGQH